MTLRIFGVGAVALVLSLISAEAQISGPPAVTGPSVASVSTTCPASGPATGAVLLTTGIAPVSISATTDQITAADCGKLKIYSNSASTAVALPSASSLGTNFVISLGAASGASAVTVTSAGGTFSLNGATSLALAAGQSVTLISDGTNWKTTGIAGGGSSASLPTTPTFQAVSVAGASAKKTLIYDDDVLVYDSSLTFQILHHWIDAGAINVLAWIVDTNNSNGVSAPVYEAYSNFFGGGAHTAPIGRYTGSNAPATENFITSGVAVSWANSHTDSSVDGGSNPLYPDCVLVYRKALANAANASVAIVSTGKVSCLAGLMTSAANYGGDGFAAGATLIQTKVSALYIMCCHLPGDAGYGVSAEANMNGDKADASSLFTGWTKQNGYPNIYISPYANSFNLGYPATWTPALSPSVAIDGVNRSAAVGAAPQTIAAWDPAAAFLAAFGLNGPPVAASPYCAATGATNAQTGTTYTILASDCGKTLTFNNSSTVTVTLPRATTAGFVSGFWIPKIVNLGAGAVVITPTTSLMNGQTNISLAAGWSTNSLLSDGANYTTGWLVSPEGTNTVDPSTAINTWACPLCSGSTGSTGAASGHFYVAVPSAAFKTAVTAAMDGANANGALSFLPQNQTGTLSAPNGQVSAMGNGGRLQNVDMYLPTVRGALISGGAPPAVSGCSGTAANGDSFFVITLSAACAGPTTMTLSWNSLGQTVAHRRGCFFHDDTTPSATINPLTPSGVTATYQMQATVTGANSGDSITAICLAN